MPYTPYHFGPSGFFALVFRKWIDVPVFMLANVIVDIEVLFWDKWPVHRYAHTLLVGAAVGVVWAVVAYPLRNLFKKIMQLFCIPYKTGFWKMVVSGILGVWLHVFIDAIYHWDMRMFWPSKANPFRDLLSRGQVKTVCVAFFIAAIILYVLAVVSFHRSKRKEVEASLNGKEKTK